jgi:hypothetical protein
MSSSGGHIAGTHEILNHGPNSQRPSIPTPGKGCRASEPGRYPTDVQDVADVLHATGSVVQRRSGALASPLGTTFAVSELILIRSWAEFHNLLVRIELENCGGIETLAEAIALCPAGSPFRRGTVRRHTDTVEIQHLSGERQIVRSVPEALDCIIAPLPVPPCEDIQQGTSWF